jgi:hypothetical protein
MHWKSIVAAAAACSFALPAAAQSCPRERAQGVPLDVTYGPPQGCGSVTYAFAGVTLTGTKPDCPLFIVFTPAHDIAAPTSSETMVEVTSTVPVTVHYFRCDTDWLIVIPIGSSCVFQNMATLGARNLLRTIPCPQRLALPQP